MSTRTLISSLGLLFVSFMHTGCPEPHHYEPYPYYEDSYSSDCMLTEQDLEIIDARFSEVTGKQFVSELERRPIMGSSYDDAEELDHVHVLRATLTIDEAKEPESTDCRIRPEFNTRGSIQVSLWRVHEQGEPEFVREVVEESDVLVNYEVHAGDDRAYRASLYAASEAQSYNTEKPPEPNSVTYRVLWAEYRGEMLVTDIYAYEFGRYIDDPDDYFIGSHPELGGP